MPIKIKCKRKSGFYRAGIKHGPEWTEYPDDRFTPSEIKRLKAEPMLVVETVAGEDPYEAMTKVQILDKIGEFQDTTDLKKTKPNKAELIERLKKHEEQQAKDKAPED